MLTFLAFLIYSVQLFAQQFNRNVLCMPDTIEVDYLGLKSGQHIHYRALQCEKVSKFGVRVEMGFNHYQYNSATSKWLGNHNGAQFGFALLLGDLNFGVAFKPATVQPREELVFDGQVLSGQAKLNPVKFDFGISYTINFLRNFAIEPYTALSTNSFLVINEKSLGKTHRIKKALGLSLGASVNKYFPIGNFQFLSVFVKFGYGLTNFQKVHNSLGFGYGDLSVGIAYKGFAKQRILKRI